MQRDGQRLSHSRGVVGAFIRHRYADARGGLRRCGQAAVGVKPKRVVMGAKVGPARAAPFAFAARCTCARHDAVPDGELGYAGTDFAHAPDEFVP